MEKEKEDWKVFLVFFIAFRSYSTSFSISRSVCFFLGGVFSSPVFSGSINWSAFLLWALWRLIGTGWSVEIRDSSRITSLFSSSATTVKSCSLFSGSSKSNALLFVVSSSWLGDGERLSWSSILYSLQNLRILFDCFVYHSKNKHKKRIAGRYAWNFRFIKQNKPTSILNSIKRSKRRYHF